MKHVLFNAVATIRYSPVTSARSLSSSSQEVSKLGVGEIVDAVGAVRVGADGLGVDDAGGQA